jgi:hypothetical protein
MVPITARDANHRVVTTAPASAPPALAGAPIAFKNPSTSSGLHSVVFASVRITTALLRLVTYQVQRPSRDVRNSPQYPNKPPLPPSRMQP